MSNQILQSELPTLSLLYATKTLLPPTTASAFTPSYVLNSKIALIRIDITRLSLPNGAIVNAANKYLRGGGGVDGAIHRAAGPSLITECRALNGCETGSAKMTNAGNLPCKKVIHAVGPIYAMTKPNHEKLLSSCYETSLKLAVENGLDAIAFSALSTGIYGYPSYEAADAAIGVVRKFLESEEGKKLDLVVFCTFEKHDEVAYHQIIPHYFPPAEKDKFAPKPATTEEAKATEGECDEIVETEPLDDEDYEFVENPDEQEKRLEGSDPIKE